MDSFKAFSDEDSEKDNMKPWAQRQVNQTPGVFKVPFYCSHEGNANSREQKDGNQSLQSRTYGVSNAGLPLCRPLIAFPKSTKLPPSLSCSNPSIASSAPIPVRISRAISSQITLRLQNATLAFPVGRHAPPHTRSSSSTAGPPLMPTFHSAQASPTVRKRTRA
jgi:hypothetical protein